MTAVLLGSSSSVCGNEVNRKRKGDWMQLGSLYGCHSSENGSSSKVPSKERDRRKSQGMCSKGIFFPFLGTSLINKLTMS